ncbi:MAG: cytochrome b5 [Chloroflexi bacterium]|nr:cytochrome b5 [Chloroflexota bacterium]
MNETISEQDLHASDGQEDRPAFVAYKGKVYDVSQSRLWRKGVHVRRHNAGHDLTADFSAAPHDESVLERVPLVGTLTVAQQEDESEAGFLTKLLDLYFDFHPHPVAVHFPVALGMVAAVFLGLYLLTSNTAFETSGYYVLWVSLVMSPFAILTGAVSWWFNYGHSLDGRFSGKISLSIILLILQACGLALRTVNPTSLIDREPLGWVYTLAVLGGVPLVAGLGWIGAQITFPKHGK